MAFAVAYSESTDSNIGGGISGATDDNQYFQIGGMVKHLASGLWVHGTYGKNFVDGVGQHDIVGWYVKAGWSGKLNHLGATHFYGEYGNNDDGFRPGTTLARP